MFEYTLVLWRTSRLDAGVGDQRTILGYVRIFLVTNRVLVERAGREIVMNVTNGETVLLERKCGRIRDVHFIRVATRYSSTNQTFGV